MPPPQREGNVAAHRQPHNRRIFDPQVAKQRGQVVFTMPRYTCIHSFFINHVVHHRAQLSVYLRLNDIPVPSIGANQWPETNPGTSVMVGSTSSWSRRRAWS